MCVDWVPSTNLLWGDLDSQISHEIVANLEHESVTLNDIEASTCLHGVSILIKIQKQFTQV